MTTNTDRPEADNPAPHYAADTPRDWQHAVLTDLLRDWWQPPAELIATLPKGGVSLQYLGHADTTRALIEADPCWTWEPMGRDANGQPVLERDDAGRPVGLWIWGTVCGVTRPAYGSCDAGKREATKELIGDAIRNLALRFGVAGSLWSRADRGGDDAAKPARRKAAKPRSVTDLPVDTTGLPEPAPGTAEFQALALLAPAASAADLAAVLKAQGIEGRGALTDQATLDRARAAVVAKWPA